MRRGGPRARAACALGLNSNPEEQLEAADEAQPAGEASYGQQLAAALGIETLEDEPQPVARSARTGEPQADEPREENPGEEPRRLAETEGAAELQAVHPAADQHATEVTQEEPVVEPTLRAGAKETAASETQPVAEDKSLEESPEIDAITEGSLADIPQQPSEATGSEQPQTVQALKVEKPVDEAQPATEVRVAEVPQATQALQDSSLEESKSILSANALEESETVHIPSGGTSVDAPDPKLKASRAAEIPSKEKPIDDVEPTAEAKAVEMLQAPEASREEPADEQQSACGPNAIERPLEVASPTEELLVDSLNPTAEAKAAVEPQPAESPEKELLGDGSQPAAEAKAASETQASAATMGTDAGEPQPTSEGMVSDEPRAIEEPTEQKPDDEAQPPAEAMGTEEPKTAEAPMMEKPAVEMQPTCEAKAVEVRQASDTPQEKSVEDRSRTSEAKTVEEPQTIEVSKDEKMVDDAPDATAMAAESPYAVEGANMTNPANELEPAAEVKVAEVPRLTHALEATAADEPQPALEARVAEEPQVAKEPRIEDPTAEMKTAEELQAIEKQQEQTKDEAQPIAEAMGADGPQATVVPEREKPADDAQRIAGDKSGGVRDEADVPNENTVDDPQLSAEAMGAEEPQAVEAPAPMMEKPPHQAQATAEAKKVSQTPEAPLGKVVDEPQSAGAKAVEESRVGEEPTDGKLADPTNQIREANDAEVRKVEESVEQDSIVKRAAETNVDESAAKKQKAEQVVEFQIGQRVERRDEGPWGTGYVTSVAPLKVTFRPDPSAKGFRWQEVRPLDESEAQPIPSQEAAINIMQPILLERGSLYKKSKWAFVRPARAGEKIETTFDGKVESVQIAEDGEWIVRADTQAKEEYVLSNEKFKDKYIQTPVPFADHPDADELKTAGFQAYKPLGRIVAVKVDAELLAHNFPQGKFVAAWGSEMLVEEGDYLCCPAPPGGTELPEAVTEVYRIEKGAFAETYAVEVCAIESQEHVLAFNIAEDDKWKCGTCSLRWEASVIQCKACESYKPGLEEADIAAMKAEAARKQDALAAMFRQPASSSQSGTGFGFAAAPTTSGFTFGASSSAPPSSGFSFGAASPSPSSAAIVFDGASSNSATGFTFGTSSSAAAPTTGSPNSAAGFTFGTSSAAAPTTGFTFGASSSSNNSSFTFGGETTPAGSGFTFLSKEQPEPSGKQLDTLPSFHGQSIPVGDVFVHGSGECDQLGLGDAQRERQKPTLVKGLHSVKVLDLAVGALHVLCVSDQGQLFSWGCNDDGALGRESNADSDCEPHRISMPTSVRARKVSCGDCHSCALDSLGRVWLWGTYKDSNGHIGISQKRRHSSVVEKSADPEIVLESCSEIASGANHTVALRSGDCTKVFAWGSNSTGQLGLADGLGCGFEEKILPAAGNVERLKSREGGGLEVDGMRLVRVVEVSGLERDAMSMTKAEVEKALIGGASRLVFEVAEREVPKSEKKRLLDPTETCLEEVTSKVTGVFASAECTFLTTANGEAFGCGLNGDGQVGLGFVSMAVRKFRSLKLASRATWLGGGLHTSAALIDGKVFTWGKSEECGHGSASTAPTMEPRIVSAMPKIRTLRCGGHHMLACSENGDVFAWGCGLTHQLANRPRQYENREDADEDPEDELKPYRISSKQLETRFVLLADGGAQHSVELAWDGTYCTPADAHADAALDGPAEDVIDNELPSKRARVNEAGAAVSDGVVAEAESAATKVETAKKQGAPAAMFGQPSSASQPPGFDVAAPAPSAGITFGGGSSTSSSIGFSFGPAVVGSFGSWPTALTSPMIQGGFNFGAVAPTTAAPTGFSFGSASGSTSSSPFTFGGGAAAGGFTFQSTEQVKIQEKKLDVFPDFSSEDAPVGDVFVHGSGECDQLGLGDSQRERQKPTLVKSLTSVSILDIAVGALHVLCISERGQLFSWGCNDDGALGRASNGDTDCEPNLISMPTSFHARKISCGDCHSCALDTRGHVWLWGTYKDSNGHIGILQKRKNIAILEKSADPAVVLESCVEIASGANHTVALMSGSRNTVFTWGSNSTGQLGLESGKGCGFQEKVLPVAGVLERLAAREGGGLEVDGMRLARLIEESGLERNALSMSKSDVENALIGGISALVLEIPERDVPKAERKSLLEPSEADLGQLDGDVKGVFASAECTFVTNSHGKAYGCGLNGDGQVGLGFLSMAVGKFRPLKLDAGAAWLGGGLHTTAALINGKVFTWGKSEECGHGSSSTAPTLEPRLVSALPKIRTLRCGGHHMLACSHAGDVFAWGCGLTHQLANRPRRFDNTEDANEDPEDELTPYRISSKQLEGRFVLLADGGAQHSVELAWRTGAYQKVIEETAQASPITEAAIEDHEEEAIDTVEDGADLRRFLAEMKDYDEDQGTVEKMPSAKLLHDDDISQVPGVTDSATNDAEGAFGAATEGTQQEIPIAFNIIADGKWKCDTCSLRWDASIIQCKACESYKPGLSEADIAALKAETAKKQDALVAMFRQPASASQADGVGGTVSSQNSGFTFGTASSAQASSNFTFGAASSGSARVASPTAAGFTFGAPSFGVDTRASEIPVGGFTVGAASSGLPMNSATIPTGSFTFGAASSGPAPTGGFTFGAASSSSAPTDCFTGGVASSGPAPTGGFTFGATSSGPAPTDGFTFGVASSGPSATPGTGFTFGAASASSSSCSSQLAATPQIVEKKLDTLPDFNRPDIPVGNVFVHGSGECDQLGLGDAQRERQKPTLVKGLRTVNILDLAVGALHVLCISNHGQLYSWGCNDDGALGRESADTDCEPHPIAMLASVSIRKVSCGDCHSCALDSLGRVWLWGTYKDSNGHIGISQKRKHASILEKSVDPAVVLESCTQIASGANHTVAMMTGDQNKVFTWGSNSTGQLGLESGKGCAFQEKIIPANASSTGTTSILEQITKRAGGGLEVDGMRLVRLIEASGLERDAMSMSKSEVESALAGGVLELVLEVPERDVPKAERKQLLDPSEAFIREVDDKVVGAFASAECTFVITASGKAYGCGLNGDGQVGLGFVSMAVPKLRLLKLEKGATWLGGNQHSSAALIDGKVHTWGKSEECGHGSASTAPTVQPRLVSGLPRIRTLRCGGHHMLACSASGDVFAWGCGLTHQLANRPRSFDKNDDADEDPDDELKPYRISSKQLESRFVLLADGGAQHSVELAWDGTYQDFKVASMGVPSEAHVEVASEDAKPPKRARVNEATETDIAPAAEAVEVVGAESNIGQAIGTCLLLPADDKWKCDTCSLRWEESVIQCKACESYKPGLSEEDIAAMKAKAAKKQDDLLAMFRQPSTASKTGVVGDTASSLNTGFTFTTAFSTPASAGFSFGSTSSGPATSTSTTPVGGFTFGAASSSSATATSTAPAVGFTFGAASPGLSMDTSPCTGAGFTVASASSGLAANPTTGFTFGTSSASTSFSPSGFGDRPASSGLGFTFQPAETQQVSEKRLDARPEFSRSDIPVGDVFVHGSGECDQLGLGDDQRERQKPTLVKGPWSLKSSIVDIAVGALHVICISDHGQLFSWGCNDDGALGRESNGDTDCEPHPVSMPPSVCLRKVSCGDCHSCALDSSGSVWLWGSYKDSNGHIGISQKRKHAAVLEKSSDPVVVLESITAIASGANHTVALRSGACSKVFAWGSNSTGQLGLESGKGCGFDETVRPAAGSLEKLQQSAGGGFEIDGTRLVRIVAQSGEERSVASMSKDEVETTLRGGASALVLELPERDVPKAERKALLDPSESHLEEVSGKIAAVFASAECTFLVTDGGSAYGCGLNGDAQVGLGFASMAVQKFRMLKLAKGATWLGGGLHTSAALLDGRVYTWGKSDECGHGSASTAPCTEPKQIPTLPKIRTLRCGGHHMLACSEAGDVFAWGCGLTHQLANRPREFAKPHDKDEDPEDELKPYRISSKQLESRFILLADGGAQHSVELAWNGEYRPVPHASADATTGYRLEESAADEPPLKRTRVDESEEAAKVDAAVAAAVAAAAEEEALAMARIDDEVMRLFSGRLLSELFPLDLPSKPRSLPSGEVPSSQDAATPPRVLWSPRHPKVLQADLQNAARKNTIPVMPVSTALPVVQGHLLDQLACYDRNELVAMVIEAAQHGDEHIREAVMQRCVADVEGHDSEIKGIDMVELE